MVTQVFKLNLIPDSAPIIIHCDQYDKGSGRLVAYLYNGDVAYTPANGATAMVQGTKPDNHGFDYSATISGNTVTMNLTEQMTACSGRVRCQLVITEGNNRTGTFVFELQVQDSALPEDSEMSASDYALVEQLIETAEAINVNVPYIGANGDWWIWNAQQAQYVDSGVDASITVSIADVTMLDPSASPYVTNTGTNTDPIFHLFIPRGKGISSIAKVSTSGLVDTYRITYSDGATYDYTVTNGAKGDTGNGISSITVVESSADSGNNVVTVHYTNGGSDTFNVKNGSKGSTGATGATGNGISSIQKTSTVGLVDTYTITYTNGQTSTFTVTNGSDAIYDNLGLSIVDGVMCVTYNQ